MTEANPRGGRKKGNRDSWAGGGEGEKRMCESEVEGELGETTTRWTDKGSVGVKETRCVEQQMFAGLKASRSRQLATHTRVASCASDDGVGGETLCARCVALHMQPNGWAQCAVLCGAPEPRASLRRFEALSHDT